MPLRLFRLIAIVGAGVLILGDWAAAADELPELHGRVVDEHGRPAAGAALSFAWDANGFSLDELLKAEKEKGADRTKFALNEGRMEPLGRPAWSGPDGRFSVKLGRTNYVALALDRERQRGALITADPTNLPNFVEVGLGPWCGCTAASALRQPVHTRRIRSL
jgi:hypothetical protein